MMGMVAEKNLFRDLERLAAEAERLAKLIDLLDQGNYTNYQVRLLDEASHASNHLRMRILAFFEEYKGEQNQTAPTS